MAVVWVEGFETHTNTNQLARKYATVSGSVFTEPGRVFGTSIEPNSLVLVTPSLGTDNTFIMGIGVRMLSNFSTIETGAQGFYVETGSSEQCHVEIESDASNGFRFQLYRGATLIDSTSYTAFGSWVYLEVKITVRTGTNGAYEMRLNGATDTSGTSVNLAASGGDGWDVFSQRWSASYNTRLELDDIYIANGTGSVNNDFLGPQTVEGIEVDTDGATNQWTPATGSDNSNMVDDLGTSNPVDTNNYNGSDTNTNKDLFNFTDLTDTAGTINAVQLGVQMAMASAGTRTVKTKYRDPDTTEADGTSHVVDSTSYDEFTEVFQQNPAATATWDSTDIDGGQFGIEVVS
jgi:hypothetical protein